MDESEWFLDMPDEIGWDEDEDDEDFDLEDIYTGEIITAIVYNI